MTDQAENQTVKQAAQEAAQQAAEQTAQQIGEAVSQAIQKMMSTTGVSTTESRLEDIGGGERLTKENADNSQILFSNQKRTYDEYQDVSLESIKRNRSIGIRLHLMLSPMITMFAMLVCKPFKMLLKQPI